MSTAIKPANPHPSYPYPQTRAHPVRSRVRQRDHLTYIMCGAPPRNVCDVAHLGDPGLEMVPVPLWEQTLALVMRNRTPDNSYICLIQNRTKLGPSGPITWGNFRTKWSQDGLKKSPWWITMFGQNFGQTGRLDHNSDISGATYKFRSNRQSGLQPLHPFCH